MKKLNYLWEKLNASFWFIPLLILLIAVGAAIGLLYLDSAVEIEPTSFWKYFFAGSADSARSILSTIAGAMIGVAGTVFSITLVALTLASSQFGSRLLRNFMYDKVNQIVLGTYVATFVYCLLVLSAVRQGEGVNFVPVFSVLVAILAAVMNIILLIIFIHHIAIGIQSDKVVSDISAAMSGNIKRLFPDEIGEASEQRAEPTLEQLRQKHTRQSVVQSPWSGYLQSVDLEYLMSLAEQHNLVLLINFRPGDYLVEGLHIVEVLSDEESEEGTLDHIKSAFIIGKVRTPLQDAEFAIHQMVEIAARALSPGVNDPYTAIACIDNLSSVLCYLARASFPSAYRYNEEGQLRLVVDHLTFEGMIDAAFHQIRQYSKDSPAVLIRLMEALSTIYRFAERPNRRKAVARHARMVLQVAERSFEEREDLEDLRERWNIND